MWDNYPFFFLKNKHTQGRGKVVLIQRHITTLLQNHGNFLLLIFVDCNNIDSVHCGYGVKDYCIHCNIIIENYSLVQHTS